MSVNLPYLTSPGTIKALMPKITSAAVPQNVNTPFVQETLNIKGGAGGVCPPFLKRIGFVTSTGLPTEIYKNFRNSAISKKAMADAIRIGYAPLFAVNEKIYEVPDSDLKGAIIQVTGLSADSRVVELICGTFNNLKAFANFKESTSSTTTQPSESTVGDDETSPLKFTGESTTSNLKFSYTLYLNLPNTNDISVFNAIFKSLKENLLDK